MQALVQSHSGAAAAGSKASSRRAQAPRTHRVCSVVVRATAAGERRRNWQPGSALELSAALLAHEAEDLARERRRSLLRCAAERAAGVAPARASAAAARVQYARTVGGSIGGLHAQPSLRPAACTAPRTRRRGAAGAPGWAIREAIAQPDGQVHAAAQQQRGEPGADGDARRGLLVDGPGGADARAGQRLAAGRGHGEARKGLRILLGRRASGAHGLRGAPLLPGQEALHHQRDHPQPRGQPGEEQWWGPTGPGRRRARACIRCARTHTRRDPAHAPCAAPPRAGHQHRGGGGGQGQGLRGHCRRRRGHLPRLWRHGPGDEVLPRQGRADRRHHLPVGRQGEPLFF